MTEHTKPSTPEDIAAAKQAARSAAEKRLRDAYPEAFRAYMVEEHEARGVTYTPRLTPAEKARQDIQRLAEEHGISIALDVETIEDGLVEVKSAEPVSHSARIAQSLQTASVPEGTPVVDGDATPEERRAAAAQAVFGGSGTSAY